MSSFICSKQTAKLALVPSLETVEFVYEIRKVRLAKRAASASISSPIRRLIEAAQLISS